jgi:hypothetical protein
MALEAGSIHGFVATCVSEVRAGCVRDHMSALCSCETEGSLPVCHKAVAPPLLTAGTYVSQHVATGPAKFVVFS